jgi:hypothetical protein
MNELSQSTAAMPIDTKFRIATGDVYTHNERIFFLSIYNSQNGKSR